MTSGRTLGWLRALRQQQRDVARAQLAEAQSEHLRGEARLADARRAAAAAADERRAAIEISARCGEPATAASLARAASFDAVARQRAQALAEQAKIADDAVRCLSSTEVQARQQLAARQVAVGRLERLSSERELEAARGAVRRSEEEGSDDWTAHQHRSER